MKNERISSNKRNTDKKIGNIFLKVLKFLKKRKGQTAIEFMLILIFMLLFTALFIRMIPKMAEILREAVLNTLYANFFCTYN